MRVLVAYATKHGSTRGIAERIAETLTQEGVDATLVDVKEAPPADQFDAFVIGGAAYMYHWLKESADYVRAHAQEMSEDVCRSHIDLYVNDFSVDLGDLGLRAVEALTKRGASRR